MRISFGVEKQLRHFDVVVMSGHVQWCQPVLSLDIRIGSLLKEDLGDRCVAVLRSNVERRETFLEVQTNLMSR